MHSSQESQRVNLVPQQLECLRPESYFSVRELKMGVGLKVHSRLGEIDL